MIYKHTNPTIYKKKDYLSTLPVFQNQSKIDFFENSEYHSHEYIEISYILEGEGYHQIKDKVFTCKKGDIYIIDENIPHCFYVTHCQSNPHLLVQNLLFIPQFICNENKVTIGIKDIYKRFAIDTLSFDNAAIKVSLNYHQSTFFENIYNIILSEIKHQKSGYLNIVNANIVILFIELTRFLKENESDVIKYKFSSRNIIENVLNYINIHFNDSNLTIDTVAKEVYTSKSYLSKLFKSTTNEYFGNYLRKVRLKKACELLRNTDYTNEQIVLMCGMKDIPTFYNHFKNYTGMTPKVYRSFIDNN